MKVGKSNGKIGIINTPKEKLVAAIIDTLRDTAPEAGYHFSEQPGERYRLILFWGSERFELAFNKQHTSMIENEQGRELVRAKIIHALSEMLRRMPRAS